MNHSVAAAMLMGLASGALTMPRSAVYGNRLHQERARHGSPEHLERLRAAAAKRARKLAKAARCSAVDGGGQHDR